jgi:hypothetical protein
MATMIHPKYGMVWMRVASKAHAQGYERHGWKLSDYKPIGGK